jgi:hypothetical protein
MDAVGEAFDSMKSNPEFAAALGGGTVVKSPVAIDIAVRPVRSARHYRGSENELRRADARRQAPEGCGQGRAVSADTGAVARRGRESGRFQEFHELGFHSWQRSRSPDRQGARSPMASQSRRESVLSHRRSKRRRVNAQGLYLVSDLSVSAGDAQQRLQSRAQSVDRQLSVRRQVRRRRGLSS